MSYEPLHARALVASALLFLTCSLFAFAGEDYQFWIIDPPDSVHSEALGINSRGTVVGRYKDVDGVNHAYSFEDGNFASIDVPGVTETRSARGINAQGEIVGNFLDPAGVRHGFVLSNGWYAQIDFPGAIDTIVEEINDSGVISGQWIDAEGNASGFVLRNGQYLDIGIPGASTEFVLSVSDDGNTLVGRAEIGEGTYGFIRRELDEFEIVGYPGLDTPCSALRDINQRGDIVGGFAVIAPGEPCFPPFAEAHGFVLRHGEFVTIDFPGATVTESMGINDEGVIVGRFTDEAGNTRGFVATPR